MAVETMGAQLTSCTTRELTSYQATVSNKDQAKAVELLGNALQNSTYEAAALHDTRRLMLSELHDGGHSKIQEAVMDHLHGVAFQGTPMAKRSHGNEQDIGTLSERDLQCYIKENYVAERAVLAAAGNIDHQDLVKMAEKSLGELPSRSSVSKPQPALYTGSEVRMRDDDMPCAHIAIAFKGPSLTNPDYIPLLLAQSVVGSWNRTMADGAILSSKLAQAIAKYDLAHSFTSFNVPYSDTALWGIYLTSDKRYQLDDLVYLVQQEWVRLCLALTDPEVQRAKMLLKARMMLALEGTSSIAEDLGVQMLTFGRHYSMEERLAMVDSVSLDKVKAACLEYIYDRCPAVAAFGPIESCPDYTRIRASTMWLRN